MPTYFAYHVCPVSKRNHAGGVVGPRRREASFAWQPPSGLAPDYASFRIIRQCPPDHSCCFPASEENGIIRRGPANRLRSGKASVIGLRDVSDEEEVVYIH